MPTGRPAPDDFVVVPNVVIVSAGVCLVCDMTDGQRIVVPTRSVASWSKVRKPGEAGPLTIKREVAEYAGLIARRAT
jgi:hypothetical protein